MLPPSPKYPIKTSAFPALACACAKARPQQHYPTATTQRIRYQIDLGDIAFADLLVMTPLHWGADAEQLAIAKQQGLTKITVDVSLLTTQKA